MRFLGSRTTQRQAPGPCCVSKPK
uniref:Uncharacterized protein n=1 Tax=Arundo donax TaxID=35708 RepID=A0A0A9AMM3_ARUDO